MTKTHVVTLSIRNETGLVLSNPVPSSGPDTLTPGYYLGDGPFSGRLANGNIWPNIIPARTERRIQCYERDNSVFTGCSGFVSYTINGETITFAFSNPYAGENKVGVGVNGKSVWDRMTSHYGRSATEYLTVGGARLKVLYESTGGENNEAKITIQNDNRPEVYQHLAEEYGILLATRGQQIADERLDQWFVAAGIADEELCRLGDMFRNGAVGVARDLEQARRWYEKSLNHKTHPRIRRGLKQLEKAMIVERHQQQAYNIDEQGAANNTALHRAAKYGHLKTYARLRFLGASDTIRNSGSRTPVQYLSRSQETRARLLQDNLSILVNQLGQGAPEILAGRMFVDNARFPDSDTKEQMLGELYLINDISPLLDLAKLAALGFHNLARRARFNDADYDSDNDNEEALREDQKLSIRLDARRETVDGIAGVDDAYGVYFQGGNTVYFGGSRTSRAESRATMIHELTHFIAYELYNSCNPYGATDTVNRDRFERIINHLRQRQRALDPILQRAFGQNYEQYNQCAAELIVRVPQMIIQYQNQAPNGIERLQNQAPELLTYYRDVFLVAIREHTARLEQRALQEWPRELFERNRQTDYIPQFSGSGATQLRVAAQTVLSSLRNQLPHYSSLFTVRNLTLLATTVGAATYLGPQAIMEGAQNMAKNVLPKFF
jgi:hypothetical protein